MPGSSQLKQFDPGQILFNWAGILISGFAEDSVLKVVKNKPDFNLKMGSTGEALAVRVRDNSGYIEFTLSQSSSSNDALSTKRKAGLAGAGFTGPALVRDLNGTTAVSAEGCYLDNMPESEWGSEGKDRVWRLIVPDISNAFIGGNVVAV